MTTPEEIFNSTRLDVVISEGVHDLPDGPDVDDWLRSVASSNQRDKAFFDERLLLFFTIKICHPTTEPVDPSNVPLDLALFLSHLQITLDAKYIAPQTQHRSHPATPARGINLSAPPRSHSYQKATPPSSETHHSIFPPHTPNPTPQTDEADRKYANTNSSTEGTVLESFVWGESSREELTGKNFALMWSSTENIWIAAYRLAVGVSFIRTSIPEPLLSLTVSATLRDKPLTITPERKVLSELIQAAGGLTKTGSQTAAVTVNGVSESELHNDEMCGLEEINLLDGLSEGPISGSAEPSLLSFPSTRLGSSLRRSAYSLQPVQLVSPTVSTPLTASSAANTARNPPPILRKSFLKTLQTVSGFQIRMKSVFVPYVVIPGSIEDEGEGREVGSEERTVVLSVELGNGSSFGGPGSTGFAVEGVDVTVGGEGAQAHLIGWGEDGLQKGDAVFPLLMAPAEQFNLLYAITFMRQSEADDVADTLRSEATGETLPSPAGSGDMQRPVTLVIRGKPFDFFSSKGTALDDENELMYLTQTFRSRWNCVLDLSSAGHSKNSEASADPDSNQDALPAPASPFPAATPSTAKFPLDKPAIIPTPSQPHAVAGSKRHTIGGLSARGQRLIPARHRNTTSVLDVANRSDFSVTPMSSATSNGRFTPTPPSLAIIANPTLTNPPGLTSPGPRTPGTEFLPTTPAYPAYPVAAVPQTPAARSPIFNLRTGIAGHAIEPRRERMTNAGSPQTPGPRMRGPSFSDKIAFQDARNEGDPIVVSVGLISPRESALSDWDLIYTLDTFGIEVFVFNRSERTRRFEVSYPDRRRRHQQAMAIATEPIRNVREQRQAPGVLPLENRIRIGPLRPHTCQSVRMQFLALRPGVHSISSLTLTDVETGFSMNLKSVMDVVVHEVNET